MARWCVAMGTMLWWALGVSRSAEVTDVTKVASALFAPTIISLALQVDEAAIESLHAKPDAAVPATMTFRTVADGDQVYRVTVHVKGQLGSARPFEDKPAFKIALGQGERFFGREHLTLNNMVQDPTMLHEALGYQVYAAVDVPVPETGYMRLTVNDQPYGLYVNVETIDRDFLQRRFGDASGILYEGNYGVDLRAGDERKFQLHEGQDPDHAQLTAFIRAVDSPGDGVFYGSSAPVDTHSFLAMMAVEALLDDWDNYYASNNYRLYWQPSVSRWYFIPTGIDQTFGGGESTTVFGATGRLFQKCLASERCTSEYASVVKSVAQQFQQLGLSTKMDALLSVIDAASQADVRRPYDDDEMKTARDVMRAFIATRPADVVAALSCLEDGRERTFAACAGAVAVNQGAAGCMELVSRTPAKNGSGVRLAPCLGGVKQRWHLTRTENAFQLKALSTGNCLEVLDAADGSPLEQASCTGTDNQLFRLIGVSQDTQMVAKQSGLCVGIAPGGAKTTGLIQRTCTSDREQSWRIQRSIFQ